MKKIILIAISLYLTGCAAHTLKDTNKLVYGLAKQQVTGYLGDPIDKEKLDGFEYLYYRLPESKWYRSEKYDYYVKLKDKRVVEFGHHPLFGETEEDSSTQD